MSDEPHDGLVECLVAVDVGVAEQVFKLAVGYQVVVYRRVVGQAGAGEGEARVVEVEVGRRAYLK